MKTRFNEARPDIVIVNLKQSRLLRSARELTIKDLEFKLKDSREEQTRLSEELTIVFDVIKVIEAEKDSLEKELENYIQGLRQLTYGKMHACLNVIAILIIRVKSKRAGLSNVM